MNFTNSELLITKMLLLSLVFKAKTMFKIFNLLCAKISHEETKFLQNALIFFRVVPYQIFIDFDSCHNAYYGRGNMS